MGLIELNGALVLGNFAKVTKRKPKNWMENGYKIVVPYDFKWRSKIGKVECDCKVCEEHFMPWYGTSWFHSKECAYIKHFQRYPGILNLNNFYDFDYIMIATTE